MTEKGKKEFEAMHEAGKKWNKQRAENEKKALAIFWKNYKATEIPAHW